jgi:outer membrane protein TolC
LFAQQTDFDAIVQPVDVKARNFSEYLVQLAWMNHPESAIAQEEVKIERGKAKNTGKEWMRDVQTSFNLNEGNLRPASADGNVFFPRYNFGLNLNLYNIVSQKTKNTVAKQEVQVANHKVNSQKLALRAETLQRYAKFKLAKELLKTRTLVEQEVYANYILIKQLYNTDEKTFEEYTLASSAYYEAQEARIQAQTEVEITRFGLEEIIGLKWEQVQHPAKDE